MSHPWLSQYPNGMPPEIRGVPNISLGDYFLNACQEHRHKTAFISLGTHLSFQELNERSTHFAIWLQSAGFKPGSKIALMLPNLLQFPIALLGALRAGCVVINCSPLYSARELETQLIDSEAEAIVILENFAATLQTCIAKTKIRSVITTQIGDQLRLPQKWLVNTVVKHIKKSVPAWTLPQHISLNTCIKQGSQGTLQVVDIRPEDLAFLQYTGGTTGIQKAAMLSHQNMLANIAQINECFATRMDDEEQLIITALPLYHIFALTVNCFWPMTRGFKNVLIPNARDTKKLIAEMKRYPFTIFTGVNTLFNALLLDSDFAQLDFSTLQISVGGGMAVQRTIAEKWREVTQCPLSQGYGLTETSPVVSINPLHLTEFNGSIGLPLPSTIISIRDEDGASLPFGEVGEICIQGPQVMKGYWNRPAETQAIFHADGALRTGDLGYMNELGYTTIVDRKKDMILVAGYNVYPSEIEDVVAAHPSVKEVAAVGVAHPFAGEVVKIFVVKKDDSLTRQELVAYCRKNLTSYKIPRRIEFRDELPKNNVGKILRRELRTPA